MTRIVEKHYNESGDSGMGFVFGIILLIVFLAIFWYWGLPMIRSTQQGGGVQIKVPDTINVNVEQTQPAQ